MTEQSQKWRAGCIVFLLLSLHVHPVAAFRSSTRETASSLVQDSESDMDASGLDSFLELIQEEEALDSSEDSTRGCWGSTTYRLYHFELETEEGRMAVELVRSPLAPRLEVHKGQTWQVRATGDKHYPLEWKAVPLDGVDPSQVVSVSIEMLQDVQYVKKTKGAADMPDGILFEKYDGTSFNFAGGLYYPDAAIARALQKTTTWNLTPAKNETGTGTGAAFASGWSSTAKGGAKAVGGYVGTTGALLGFGFAGAADALIGVLAGLGVTLTTSGQAVTGVSLAQTLMATAGAGTIGFASGALVGFGVGAVVGVGVGVVAAVRNYAKMSRELKLTASDKIFEKLTCHRMMKTCKQGKDTLLIPKWAECGAVRLGKGAEDVEYQGIEDEPELAKEPEAKEPEIVLDKPS